MPHDSKNLSTWQLLLNDRKWAPILNRAAQIDSGDVNAVAKLRADAPAVLVHAALELANARRKVATKFPADIAARLIADVPGVEMATSQMCADYKTARFAQVFDPPSTTIHDLCCGIGGDAMSLVNYGFDVIAIDQDPLRAWMAERNAGCASKCGDVESFDLASIHCFHLDPSRRIEATRRRAWRFEDYQPGPEFTARLLAACPDGAIKLGPGVDLDSIPRNEAPTEIEFISESGRLTQAVLWTGRLASARRRATLLPGRVSLQSNDVDDRESPPTADQQMQYLYTFDPAIERARLVSALCEVLNMPTVHPAIGLLTSDSRITNSWVRAFELVERMPWNERRVKRWLSEHDGGVVEVKTRDRVVDPDVMQRRLRCGGDMIYTVFVMRIDRRIDCFIAKRCDSDSTTMTA